MYVDSGIFPETEKRIVFKVATYQYKGKHFFDGMLTFFFFACNYQKCGKSFKYVDIMQ